jgi:STAS domain
VVVELTPLSFIDSSGVGFLIQAYRAFPNGSRMHVVIGRGSQVERVFGIRIRSRCARWPARWPHGNSPGLPAGTSTTSIDEPRFVAEIFKLD